MTDQQQAPAYLPLPADAEVVIGNGEQQSYVDPSRGLAEFKIVDIKLQPGRPSQFSVPGQPDLPQFMLRWESCKEPGATIPQWITYKANNYYGENHNMSKLLCNLFPNGIPHGFRIPSGLIGMHCMLQINNHPTNKKADGTPKKIIAAHIPLDDDHPLCGVRDEETPMPAAIPPSSGARVVTPQPEADAELPF